MSSFCYRGDVPERLKTQALNRLLEKLFLTLNEAFLEEIAPRTERAQVPFEVLSGATDASLVHRNELAILYASRGEWNRAIEMWQDSLLNRPDLTAAHYNLAMAFRAMGRLSLAEDQLKKAIALAPRPLYRNSLAELREALGSGGR
jgi:tetratricopeptide (TPR) repeat protein